MDPELRNLKALQDRINKLQADLIRRFSKLVDLAEVKKTESRGGSAVVQFQIQAETGGLIRAAEEVQSLIRQMQEAWLFGQLDTLGESRLQKEADENAKAVAGLLRQLTERQALVSQVERPRETAHALKIARELDWWENYPTPRHIGSPRHGSLLLETMQPELGKLSTAKNANIGLLAGYSWESKSLCFALDAMPANFWTLH